MPGIVEFDLKLEHIPGTNKYTISSKACHCERVVTEDWVIVEMVHIFSSFLDQLEAG